MLATLAASEGLVIRPPHAPAAPAGATVPVVLFSTLSNLVLRRILAEHCVNS